MNNTNIYSTQIMSPMLIQEIKDAVKSIPGYGSVEIYVQDGCVSQISTRKIKKTYTGKNKVGRLDKK